MRKSAADQNIDALLLLDRSEMAAKVRGARAVLGWSQTDLGNRAGLTQRSIHRVEQGAVDVRRSTALAIEKVLWLAGVQFEEMPEGGFKIVVQGDRARRRRATAKRR